MHAAGCPQCPHRVDTAAPAFAAQCGPPRRLHTPPVCTRSGVHIFPRVEFSWAAGERSPDAGRRSRPPGRSLLESRRQAIPAAGSGGLAAPPTLGGLAHWCGAMLAPATMESVFGLLAATLH